VICHGALPNTGRRGTAEDVFTILLIRTPELTRRRTQWSFLNTFFEEKTTYKHTHRMENERADHKDQAGITWGFRKNFSLNKGYSDKTEQPEKDAYSH
jgi:hypothetical protein